MQNNLKQPMIFESCKFNSSNSLQALKGRWLNTAILIHIIQPYLLSVNLKSWLCFSLSQHVCDFIISATAQYSVWNMNICVKAKAVLKFVQRKTWYVRIDDRVSAAPQVIAVTCIQCAYFARNTLRIWVYSKYWLIRGRIPNVHVKYVYDAVDIRCDTLRSMW